MKGSCSIELNIFSMNLTLSMNTNMVSGKNIPPIMLSLALSKKYELVLTIRNLLVVSLLTYKKPLTLLITKILLSKLAHYGIKGFANKWLGSYLTNRSQSVNLNGATSDELKITCGVPQGSILGPLLFTVYINDMHKAFKKCLVHHFADDTNLLFTDKDPKTIQKTLNKELQELVEWLRANRLSLNVAKTEFIIFRPPRKSLNNRITLKLDQKTIFESTKIKYLGLLLDSRLTWKFHINELCKKLCRSVGMLYKLRHLCPLILI